MRAKGLKRLIKASVGAAVFKSGLYRAAFTGKAIVVVFHRVNAEEAVRPLVCRTEDFYEFCEFFARHFVVVSLGQLLEKLGAEEDVSRHLVITFDDGYKDNADVAAAMLKELGLPATFFVTTGFIGSGINARWDRKVGVTSRWMDWADVRRLADSGFEVGVHTVSHADLSELSDEEVRREVVDARARLEEELRRPITLFACPYGRQRHISPFIRKVVEDAGLKCCASSNGGLITSATDLFSLPRVPLDSAMYSSPYDFGQALWRDCRGRDS